jgi:hypothetical protein
LFLIYEKINHLIWNFENNFEKKIVSLKNIEEMFNKKYWFIVTEQEVVRGIIESENNTDCTLAFFREIQNINVKLFQHSAKFIDINFAAKNVDEEAQQMLSDLRDVKVQIILFLILFYVC